MIQWRRALGLLPLALLFVAWEVTVELKVYPQVLLPAPAKVAAVFVNDWDTLLENAAASLARVVTGISFSFLVAVPLGILIGRYRILDMLSDWSIQIFRSFPAISLIPLAIMFFGIGDKPAIILIWFAAFWPLAISTIFGVKNVERTLLKVARAAHANDWLVLTRILLPSAMPAILTGLRLAVGAGWLTVVTAEMMAVRSGLGYMIMYAQTVFKPELILAGIFVIGMIGLVLDQCLRLLRRRLCRWQDGLVMDT